MKKLPHEEIEEMTPEEAYRYSQKTLGEVEEPELGEEDAVTYFDEDEPEGGGAPSEGSQSAAPAVQPALAPRTSSPDQNDPKLDEYIKNRDENRRRAKVAAQAGMAAQSAKREELLASGLYFDDGRGNIKLKKQYREKYQRLPGGRYVKTGNNTSDRAGETRAAITGAGQAAYDETWGRLLDEQKAAQLGAFSQKTQDTVQRNKAELQSLEQQKKDEAINRAKGNLAIYDGMVAALKDLTDEANAGRIEDETREVWGGKDEQGRDGRWKYDEQGRAIGQADARRVATGRRFRNGYVGRNTIADINNRLKERGNNTFRITGIIARQGVDGIGNASGEPMFYVQGVRTDGGNGPGIPFGKTMTLRSLYRMGVESGNQAGVDDAEAAVIRDLGDVMGVAKAKSDAVANGEKIALERMRQEGADRRAEKKLALEEKALKAKTAANSEKVKIPSQMLSALFGKVSNGEKDRDGRPIIRSLTTKEIMERYALLKDVMEGNKGVSDIVALVGLEGLDDKEKQALGLSSSQATPSSGYNNTNDTIPEFNPNSKYGAGDKFSRKGVVYEVGKDGQPHRVK